MNAKLSTARAILLFAFTAAFQAAAAEAPGLEFDCAHVVRPSLQQTADLVGLNPALPGNYAKLGTARGQLRRLARLACQQHADASRIRLVLESTPGQRLERDARDHSVATTDGPTR